MYFSSFSIVHALSMAVEGAKAHAATEMRHVLHATSVCEVRSLVWQSVKLPGAGELAREPAVGKLTRVIIRAGGRGRFFRRF
jgi:hypothetical protein